MRVRARLLIATVALSAAVSTTAPAARPDAMEALPGPGLAIDWNRKVLAMAEEEDGFLTLKGVRTAAMVHLAMHEALNSIEARYAGYTALRAAPGADPVAAAAQAACEVAVRQFPGRREELTRLLDQWLGTRPDTPARARGIALGTEVAEAIVEIREGDAWNGEAEYTWHPMSPGVYAEFPEHSATPTGFVFGAGWAKATPFMLERPDQFRSPPPPAIESDAYAEAFREVKEVGSDESDTRTADQTHLAMWWKDFVENSHNRLARELAARTDLDLWKATRLMALLNMSIYDAYVNVFDNKFFYNHWRPYTAIRWAAHDGNPDTHPDPDWDNTHGHTYAFPSYPSAHGCASAAAMAVLADTFGDELPFTMTTHQVDRAGPMSGKIEMDPPTRSFGSFLEAAMECSMSRVYLGIHFRYDSVEGHALGRKVARYGIGHYLLPLKD